VVEQNLVFEEYAKMFCEQGFDNKFKELENKKERMKALVLCMRNTEEKLDALAKIDSLKSITRNSLSDLSEKIDECTMYYTVETDSNNLKKRSKSLNIILDRNSNKFKRVAKSCSNISEFLIK
jgi:hypothetical protein